MSILLGIKLRARVKGCEKRNGVQYTGNCISAGELLAGSAGVTHWNITFKEALRLREVPLAHEEQRCREHWVKVISNSLRKRLCWLLFPVRLQSWRFICVTFVWAISFSCVNRWANDLTGSVWVSCWVAFLELQKSHTCCRVTHCRPCRVTCSGVTAGSVRCFKYHLFSRAVSLVPFGF